jgi:hypothetical protein
MPLDKNTDNPIFLKLKRIPYQELKNIIYRMSYEESIKIFNSGTNKEAFLNECGWTLREFVRKLMKEIQS